MNSIAGIYRFDGRAADPALLERMLASLPPAMAGPLSVWQAGPVGLGVRRPARAAAPAPFPGTGYPIAADARIDNRDEVGARLGLDAARLAAMSDAALIAAGYAAWGHDAPAHLVGDYAFALWDAAQRRLFCARDHFGLRPFYYHLGAQFFVFASDLHGVLACPEVAHRLDEVRIGFHLAVAVADKTSTFYQDVKRLAPAHSLQVDAQGVAAYRRYWRLDAAPPLPLATASAHAATFRHLFAQAMRCRLPPSGPFGVLLSGGLDSTAVACTARYLMQPGGTRQRDRLRSYSAVFDQTPECDERAYIAETLLQGGVDPCFVAVEAQGPLAQIGDMLSVTGEPFSSPTFYILWQLYQAAHAHGTALLLDGIDGDTAVYHGDAYLAELARAGRWGEFFDQAHKLQAHGHHTVDGLMKRYGEPYLLDLACAWRWRAWGRAVRALTPYTDATRRRMLAYYGLRPLARRYRTQVGRAFGQGAVSRRPSLIGARLWQETALAERMAVYTAQTTMPPASAQEEHARLLEAPLLAHVFELSSHVSRAFGIDTRHPFADRRLVEFCYTLPGAHKLIDGWTRPMVRQGLAGILPEAVRLRGGKTENSAAVTKALRRQDAACLEQVMAHSRQALAPYVDLPALTEAYRRYRHSGNRQDEMLVWQAATLALWLQRGASSTPSSRPNNLESLSTA
ncbi:MAG: lasso peptide isopeptide bond-forming cyclase [Caldilineaceae bacterium]|nr:lasso peptide isopeptide bond-forming cyclase [Caldilineaceae bacterium]